MATAFAPEFAVPPLFDYLAVYVWAVSGAIVGARKGFDMMGVAVVAIVSSVGGGMLRDGVFLQRTPLVLTDWVYLPLILTATAVVVFIKRRHGRVKHPEATDRLVNVIDALGTPAYAVIGMQLAMGYGLPLSGVLFIGIVNGVGGGLLRDVLVRDVPELFKPGQFSALVVLVACGLFIAMVSGLGIPNFVAAFVTIVVSCTARLLIIRFNWRSRPVMRDLD